MRKLVALVILMLGAVSISGSNERIEKQKDINQSLDGLKSSLDSLKTMWDERN